MILLHYPKCNTCKKAIKFLKDNNINYTERDIVKDNPKKEELKKWIKQSDKPKRKNKRNDRRRKNKHTFKRWNACKKTTINYR